MKTSNIKIAIVDDHKIYLESLKGYLERNDDISFVDIFTNLKDFTRSGRKYDILLLDLDLDGSSGFDYFDRDTIKNVLMLTSHKEISNINLAYKLGAKGYILKNAETEEMLDAIKIVAGGKNFYSKNVIIDNKMSKQLTLDTLSEKQIEILRLISRGYSYQEISEKIFISPSTVKVHKYNILKKLNLKNDEDLFEIFFLYFNSKPIK